MAERAVLARAAARPPAVSPKASQHTRTWDPRTLPREATLESFWLGEVIPCEPAPEENAVLSKNHYETAIEI